MADTKNAVALLDSLGQIAAVLEDVMSDGKVGLSDIPQLIGLMSTVESAYREFQAAKTDFSTYDLKAAQDIAQKAFDVIMKLVGAMKN